jgi:hypothetical protein
MNRDAAPVNCALCSLSFETEHVSVIVFDARARAEVAAFIFAGSRLSDLQRVKA